MFAKAYELASSFTGPLIISTRKFSGEVSCGIGSFVVINKDGWFLTATHILESAKLHEQHRVELAEYLRKRQAVEDGEKRSAKQKKKHLRRVKANSEWITNHSFWWGQDNFKVANFNAVDDLLIGKFENFDPSKITSYPVIKNPYNLRPGTSLCKLGHPFHNATADYDESTGNFRLAPGTLPIPRFPIDGIFTRTIHTNVEYLPGKVVKYIETSSPGLRGQSGGPIFDKDGVVWGIQSHTNSLPLGFEPVVRQGNRQVVESQFLNVGVGIHPEVIINVLDSLGVSYALSTD